LHHSAKRNSVERNLQRIVNISPKYIHYYELRIVNRADLIDLGHVAHGHNRIMLLLLF